MRRTLAPLLLLALSAAPARAELEDGYFPLAVGNEWTYTAGSGTQPQVVSVDRARTIAGRRQYRLLGYNGSSTWVWETATGRVYAATSRPWYRFDAAVGAGWTFSIATAGVPGSHGARLTVVSRDEAVTVPAGTFSTIHVRWRAQAIDAGITDEWFARGVGLVRRATTSFAGPRVLSLRRARIAGTVIDGSTTSPGGGGGGITGALTGTAFGLEGTIPAARVRLRVVLDQALDRPTAMAFNPRDRSLWIVNRGDDSSVVVDAPGTSAMRFERFADDSAHFMNNPMALAFSRGRNEFATVQDTANDYNGGAAPNQFMGPTVWTADRSTYDGGASSHLDMLHHSPLSVGIAAGAPPASGPDRREYWVFNGQSGCIDRYFFNAPHVLGGHDHSDGLTFRYGSGLRRVAGVPGHLALDAGSGVLYVADTGNGRVARLDTRATDPSSGVPVSGHHTETPLYRVPNARIEGLTPAGALSQPAGLILSSGDVVVSEHGTGHVRVFGRDGAEKGDADTGLGPGTITGLAESPGGRLYLLDARGGRVLELQLLP